MRAMMLSPMGKIRYRRRRALVEPVIGVPGASRRLHLAPYVYCSLGVFTAGSWLAEALPLLIM
jgi:hypothetical protein